MQDIVVGYEGERPSSPMVPVISRRPNRIIGSRVAALDETVMVDQHIARRLWSEGVVDVDDLAGLGDPLPERLATAGPR